MTQRAIWPSSIVGESFGMRNFSAINLNLSICSDHPQTLFTSFLAFVISFIAVGLKFFEPKIFENFQIRSVVVICVCPWIERLQCRELKSCFSEFAPIFLEFL